MKLKRRLLLKQLSAGATIAITGIAFNNCSKLVVPKHAGSSSDASSSEGSSPDGSLTDPSNPNLPNPQNPPSPSEPITSADFIQRRSDRNVVWWHGFEHDEEITRHIISNGSNPLTGDDVTKGVKIKRTLDSSGSNCLEVVALGGELSAPYVAGSTTMTIVDDYLWPDPAVTGHYYFVIVAPYPTFDTQNTKNLFRVKAKSGRTLSVTRIAWTSSAFNSTALSYPAGSLVGQEGDGWRRVFSALPASENGKTENDPAASGQVPIRSKNSSGLYGVPRDSSIWGYGVYANPDDQATWGSNWSPWVGGTSYTRRGGPAGTKENPFDGSVFELSFAVKLDPDYYTNHVMPTPTSSFWGRKTWVIDAERSVPQQLVSGVGPGNNKYSIPSTLEAPWGLRTDRASVEIGINDKNRENEPLHRSLQPGSAWDVAPWNAWPEARNSSGNAPSTGLPTPDGSTAWEFPAGRWIYFRVRVEPGHSGVDDTKILVQFADVGASNYKGEWTTLMNLSDARIRFGNGYNGYYPPGSFSRSTVDEMDMLPGWQAFTMFHYLNIFQDHFTPPPRRSYYYRMKEVIFSRGVIAPPLSTVTPSWRPASGQVNRVVQGNGVLQNNYRNVVAPYYHVDSSVRSVNEFSGATLNPYLGPFGAIVGFGGGHASSNDNSVWGLELNSTTMKFRRYTNPTPFFGTGTDSTTRERNAGGSWVEPIHWPTADALHGEVIVNGVQQIGIPAAPHSYGAVNVIGPENGGAAFGSFITVARSELNYRGGQASASAHVVDFPNASGADGSYGWKRDSDQTGAIGGVPNYVSALVSKQNKIYYLASKSAGNSLYYDLTTKLYGVRSGGAGALINDGASNTESMVYVPEHDLILYCGEAAGKLRIQFQNVATSDMSSGWSTASLNVNIPLRGNPSHVCWCPDALGGSGRLIVGAVDGDDNCVYEIQIPAIKSNSWDCTRVGFPAGQIIPWAKDSTWPKGWHYNKKAKCIVYIPFVRGDSNANADVVYVYTPRGV